MGLFLCQGGKEERIKCKRGTLGLMSMGNYNNSTQAGTNQSTLSTQTLEECMGPSSSEEPRPAEVLAEGGGTTEWVVEDSYKPQVRKVGACYRNGDCYCHECFSPNFVKNMFKNTGTHIKQTFVGFSLSVPLPCNVMTEIISVIECN